MSLPIREKNVNTITYEQLLMGRIQKAIEAKDVGDGSMFDEIIESMEMLLKLRPSLYNELMQYKMELINEMQRVIKQVEALASNARNQIQSRVFFESEMSVIEWDVRKDYFDKIIEVLGNNQLIPIQTEEPAGISSYQQKEIEQREEPEEIEEQQQDSNIQQSSIQSLNKKPKLSFNTKKFDV